MVERISVDAGNLDDTIKAMPEPHPDTKKTYTYKYEYVIVLVRHMSSWSELTEVNYKLNNNDEFKRFDSFRDRTQPTT